MIAQPTTEYQLFCGWKVWLVQYFTQGQYDEIQRIAMEGITVETSTDQAKVANDIARVIDPTAIMKMTDKAKELAVTKIVLPDGQEFEGESLTLEIIKSIPYNPQVGDELKSLIDEISEGKKKPTTDGTSAS